MTDHLPLLERNAKAVIFDRIISCAYNWQTPPDTSNSDDAFATHFAIGVLTVPERQGFCLGD